MAKWPTKKEFKKISKLAKQKLIQKKWLPKKDKKNQAKKDKIILILKSNFQSPSFSSTVLASFNEVTL
jgi:hypothetical protein